jgi:hypothetical protein
LQREPLFDYAYFFFDGRDSQKGLQLYENLIRSLISQLSDQFDGIPAALVGIYGNGHQQPSTDSLRYTLLSVLQGFQKAYIIIDSLDECAERVLLLNWIRITVELKLANVHLLVASRQERDIEDRLQLLSPIRVCLGKQSENRDIEEYLDQILQTDSDFKQWGEKTQGDIRVALMKGGQGIYAPFYHEACYAIHASNISRFRWTALQLDALRRCRSSHAVTKQLASLPKDLLETYDRIMLCIDEECIDDAKRFLKAVRRQVWPDLPVHTIRQHITHV